MLMTFATTENTVLAFGLLVMVTALMLAHGIGRRAVHGFAGHGRSVLVLRRTWVFVWILLAIGITTVGFHSGWMGSGSVDAPGDTAPADSSDIAIMTIVQTGIGLQFALPLLFLLLLDRQFRVGLYKYRTAGIGRVGLVGALILTGAGVLLAGLQPLLEGVQFDAYRGGVFPSGAVLSWMLLFIWFLLLALYGAHAFRWIAAASPYRGALTYWADESAGVATGLLARPLRALIFILRILRPSTRHARRLATTVALQYSVLICMMGISWLLVTGLPVGPTGAILYFIYNHAIAFLLFLVCAAAWWMYRTYLRIFHQDRRYLMRSTTPIWLYGSVVLFLLALVPTRIAERQYDRQHIDVLRNVHAMVHAEDYRSLPLDGRFVLSRAMVRLPDGAALRTLYARDEFDFKDFLKALK
ncbi:MAG: hypothetical protein KDK27_11405, partial [Leptospiraceae bacterium]|nr:hypothetical protein [Leptospiraceae bacterium]